MLKLCEVPTTWIHWLSKPENMDRLVEYANCGDKSPAKLGECYTFLVCTLQPTPAWNVSGVNKMINEVGDGAIAVLERRKKGKTSAPAVAKKLLASIKWYGQTKADPHYYGNYKLRLLTPQQLDALAAMS